MGIIEESKRAQAGGISFWRNKKFLILVAILIIAGGAYAFWPDSINKQDQADVVVKTWNVVKDDIVISVEADGKVVAEDGVELSFSVSGDTLEVKEVFVKEGQSIKKGDKIATVKTETLELNVSQAYSNYQSALASYNDRVDGATEEDKATALSDIEQAEISLEQSKISLEKTKISAANKIRAAEKTLEDREEDLEKNKDFLTSEDAQEAYDDLVESIKSVNIDLENILPKSDEIIGVDNKFINDDFETALGAMDSNTLNYAKSSYQKARSEKEKLDSLVISLSKYSNFEDIDTASLQADTALDEMEDHLYYMQELLKATITFSNLSQSKLDSFKSTINSNRTSINNKIASLSSREKAVEDIRDNLDNYLSDYEDAEQDLADAKVEAEQDIANAGVSVRAKEIALENRQSSYDELIAPLTNSEMASARSSLTSASVSLQKAQNELSEATLLSPIDGEVVLLNYKVGDIILKDDSNPMAQIINNDTLFVEVNIEEADISKVKVGQKAIATFDAIEDLELEGEISFISLTSKTSNNGIVTYQVRILFENVGDSEVREGMTAFVDFIAQEALDVLVVPVSAIRNVNGEPSAQLESGDWTSVVTGFTDGKMVEIISGLNEGDKILY